MIREIDSEELMERMKGGSDLCLLDIRTDAEVARGVLPGARHVPMHLLPGEIPRYPSDKDIVLYCRSGARSYHACSYLAQHGARNVINLSGGILAWARHGYEIEPPGARDTGT
ncbi:MAG: rhodanese-like domain-containing protein [Chromatiales bacterium]